MSTPLRLDLLSHNERAVLRVIWRHQGRDAAIPVPEVARQADVAQRQAQAIVKSLVETHRIPIGSSFKAERPGWYLCVNADEVAENRDALRRRAVSILGRAKAFDSRHSAMVALIQGQQLLELEAAVVDACS